VPHRRTDAPLSALPQCPGDPVDFRGRQNVPLTKHQRTILSISAVAADHDSLQRILRDQLWQIRIASNYQEAVACLCHDRVDVVVCERHLPDGTWKDLLGHIAEMLDPPALVVTSGVVDAHFRAGVRAMGGYDLITKPFDAEEVSHLLATADLNRVSGAEMLVHT
jgi:two-component system, NtrC family, response regulator HydG